MNISTFLRQESRPQPYALNIEAKDEYGTVILQQEQGDELGNKRGSYGYVDPYGISRQVEYVADELGFRAVIKTNEPGTESQNPADVLIQSSAAPAPYSSSGIAAPSSAYGVAPIVKQPIRQVIAAPAAYGPVLRQPLY